MLTSAVLFIEPNIFWERLRYLVDSMNPVVATLVVVIVLALSILFFYSEHRVEWLLMMVVASGALVGSSNDIVDNGASILRWIGIGLLALTPLMAGGVGKAYRGSPFLFMIHAIAGFLFLFNCIDPGYQIQRSLLLLASVVAIPAATITCSNDVAATKRLYTVIGIVGSLFAVNAAIQLPSQLGVQARFAGSAKGVPFFALVLGSLLPFMFLNAWRARSFFAKAFYFPTLILGFVVLFFTAQRTGTIAGVIGILPIIFVLGGSQKARLVLILAIAGVGFAMWIGQAGLTSIDYITSRYDPNAGVSGRDILWNLAWEKVSRNFLIGHGTGASDIAADWLFHNGYLEAWFNGGLVGLCFFLAALGRSIYVGAVLLIRGVKELAMEIGLNLGVTLAACFISFFEGHLAGSSTIVVILFLITVTITEEHYRRFRWAQKEQKPMQVIIYDHPMLRPIKAEP